MGERRPCSVGELLAARASELGEKTYLVFGERSYSFAEVYTRARAAAGGLKALGVGKGRRVALAMNNCPEFIFTWWGLMLLGATLVPINTRLTVKEAAYIINHSEAHAVVLGEGWSGQLQELKPVCKGVQAWVCWEGGRQGARALGEVLGGPVVEGPEELGAEHEAAVLYTSGTTGFPKGVVHTHGNYLLTAASFASACALAPTDTLLTANPLFHVNAQFYSCMGTLWAGAKFVLAPRFSASRMWDWTRAYNANKVVMLLAITTILFNRPPTPRDADNPVELVVAGGAPRGHYHDFEQRFGVKLQTLYSLTEAPLGIMSPIDQPCVDGAVGLPVRPAWGGENRVRIVDEAGRDCPPGTPGQILISNPAVMKGYLKDPEATAQALKEGWVHTGDLGKSDEKGWVYFLGRAKDVIRKKGENISAAEVEAAIAAHPAVKEAAVKAVQPPDAVGEDEVMAFVVWEEGQELSWQELAGFCRQRLADFKVPRFWAAASALPKNATGRVMKNRLGDHTSPGVVDLLKEERK